MPAHMCIFMFAYPHNGSFRPTKRPARNENTPTRPLQQQRHRGHCFFTKQHRSHKSQCRRLSHPITTQQHRHYRRPCALDTLYVFIHYDRFCCFAPGSLFRIVRFSGSTHSGPISTLLHSERWPSDRGGCCLFSPAYLILDSII